MTPRELDLEETNRQLRKLLAIEPEREKIDRLQVALKLPRYLAIILATLHDAGSRWLTAERLAMALPDGDRGVPAIRVHICRIRKAIGEDAILHYTDVGYTLGAPGVLAVKSALSEVNVAHND